MPLTAIESFAPLSVPPDDFDLYWEATLAALDETPSKPVLARESAPSSGLTLDRIRFTSLGQARIAGYLLAHDGPEPKPLVVHSHGYNSQYDVMLHWALAGCHVLGIDFRGFGRSTGMPLAPGGYVLTGIESPQTSILRGAVCDLVQARRVAASLLGWRASSTITYGFSFGGAMALMASAVEPSDDLVVIGQPTFGWHKERLRLSQLGSSMELNRYFDEHPESAAALRTLDYFDALHYAPRLTSPVMLGVGLDDDVVPSRSVLAIANCLPEAGTEIRLLPVAHSADPRESLWADFDNEWLALARDGVPADFGSASRRLGTIERAIA